MLLRALVPRILMRFGLGATLGVSADSLALLKPCGAGRAADSLLPVVRLSSST